MAVDMEPLEDPEASLKGGLAREVASSHSGAELYLLPVAQFWARFFWPRDPWQCAPFLAPTPTSTVL